MKKNREMLGKKEAEQISIDNVLGYASGLAGTLKEDDLITMRRHTKNPDGYRESFAQCAERVKQILTEKRKDASGQIQSGQMTLFQILYIKMGNP